MPDQSRGRFITLEGGEGTGKSTLAEGLKDALQSIGIDVALTREPGGTPVAEAIREICLFPPDGSELSPMTQALLMNAARKDHLENKILPTLATGHWVICDRFSDSTRVYQSVEEGLPIDELVQLETLVVANHLPDLTFVLDASEDTTLARRDKRAGSKDAFEMKDAEFHNAVKQAFRTIALHEPDRCRMIDANKSAADVLDEACTLISDRFGVIFT